MRHSSFNFLPGSCNLKNTQLSAMLSFIILLAAVTARAAPGLIRGAVLTPSSSIVSSPLFYASQLQLPVTNTIQYTVTNNVLPFYVSNVQKTGLPITAMNNIVPARVFSAMNALPPVIGSSVSATAVSSPSFEGQSRPDVPVDSQILSTDGRSGLIVEKLPDRVTEVVGGTEVTDSVPLQEGTEVQNQPANLPEVPTGGSQDTVEAEIIRQDPLLEGADIGGAQTPPARSAVTSNDAETGDDNRSQMSFSPAPRDTYAKYYTGPPVVRS